MPHRQGLHRTGWLTDLQTVVDRVHLRQRAHHPPARTHDRDDARVGGELDEELARGEGVRGAVARSMTERLPRAALEPAELVFGVLERLAHAPRRLVGATGRAPPRGLECVLGGKAADRRIAPRRNNPLDRLPFARNRHDLTAILHALGRQRRAGGELLALAHEFDGVL